MENPIFWDCIVRIEDETITINRIEYGTESFQSFSFPSIVEILADDRVIMLCKCKVYTGTQGQLRAIQRVLDMGDGIYQIIRGERWRIYQGKELLFEEEIDPLFKPKAEHADYEPNLMETHEFAGNIVTQYIAGESVWFDINQSALCTREDVRDYCDYNQELYPQLVLQVGRQPESEIKATFICG